MSVDTVGPNSSKDVAASAASQVSVSICELAGCGCIAAALCWVCICVGYLAQITLAQWLLCVASLVIWVYAASVSFSEDFGHSADLLALPVGYLPRRPILKAMVWRCLALGMSALTWAICVEQELPGWRWVRAVFFINVCIFVLIWSARSVALRAVPRDEDRVAVRAARRANTITTWMLGISAELWLNPLFPTSTGPSWPYVPLFLVVAFVFAYASAKSYYAADSTVQWGLRISQSVVLVEPDDRTRLDAFRPAVQASYVALVLSVIVYLFCSWMRAPHWEIVQSIFSYEVVGLAAILGAKLTAARAIYAEWNAEEQSMLAS